MITPLKEAAETTARPVRSKSPINDSPVDILLLTLFQFDILERLTNHLQQQILLLQTEPKNKGNYIKILLLQLSKQRYHLLFPKSK